MESAVVTEQSEFDEAMVVLRWDPRGQDGPLAGGPRRGRVCHNGNEFPSGQHRAVCPGLVCLRNGVGRTRLLAVLGLVA